MNDLRNLLFLNNILFVRVYGENIEARFGSENA